MPSFYQDRLGTNIGKVEKRLAFLHNPQFRTASTTYAEVCQAQILEAIKLGQRGCGNAFLFRHFDTEKPNIYQDRLGTNIGNVEKERLVCRQVVLLHGEVNNALLVGGTTDPSVALAAGEKTPCLFPLQVPFEKRSRLNFTKTGSGQNTA
jgi:hypothetical protein